MKQVMNSSYSKYNNQANNNQKNYDNRNNQAKQSSNNYQKNNYTVKGKSFAGRNFSNQLIFWQRCNTTLCKRLQEHERSASQELDLVSQFFRG